MKAKAFGCRVYGLRFRVYYGFGFRVYGLRFRA